MVQRTLPGLGLTAYWDLGFDGWNDEHDPDTRLLSALVQCRVLSRVTALPGSPTNGDMYIVPSGGDADKIAIRDNGAWVYIIPGEGFTAYVIDDAENVQYDGAAWQTFAAGGSGPTPYDVPLSFAGLPDASALIGRLIAVRDIDFPADFAGSAGYVGVNPDATYAIDVQDDGASIGTISISTSGVFTFTTASGTAKTVVAGSRIDFYAPAGAETSIEDIAATLLGSVA